MSSAARASRVKPRAQPTVTPSRAPWVGVMLAAVCVAVYGRTWGFGSLSLDDAKHIFENPAMNPPSLAGILQFWTAPYFGLYIPITYTLWTIAAAVGWRGGTPPTAIDPTVFHLLNVGVHTANTLLVFSLLRAALARSLDTRPEKAATRDDRMRAARRMKSPFVPSRRGLFARRIEGQVALAGESHDTAAALGALVFAVHPIQVEAVAWISGMKDLLFGLFALAAMYLACVPSSRQSTRVWRFALATAMYLLALCAKPTAVVVPLCVLAFDVCLFERPLRASVRRMLPWMLLAMPFILVTHALQPAVSGAPAPPFWARPLIAGDALTFYLYKLAVPIHFGIDYGRTPAAVMSQRPWVYAAWVIPACFGIAAWRTRTTRPWLLAGALIVVLGCVPVLGLVPFFFQKFSTVADRYLYFSLLGVALIVAGELAQAGSNIMPVIAAAVCAGLAGISVFQTGVWRDSATLFRQALVVNPRSILAHSNLGIMDYQGQRFEVAASHFRAAVAVAPQDPEWREDLGAALAGAGQVDDAIREFETAVALAPDSFAAHLNLGNGYLQAQRFRDAREQYAQALKLQPGDPLALAAQQQVEGLQRQGR